MSQNFARLAALRLPAAAAVAADGTQTTGGGTERLAHELLLPDHEKASLKSRLDPARFVRVSRSSIVNADRVRELQPMFNGGFVVMLRDGTKVAGSRRYRVAFNMLTR